MRIADLRLPIADLSILATRGNARRFALPLAFISRAIGAPFPSFESKP